MALTFGTIKRFTLGDKKMHICDVTHDGSATAVTAANLDLHYIDHAMATAKTTTDYPDLPTNSGTGLVMTALSASAVTTIVAIGY